MKTLIAKDYRTRKISRYFPFRLAFFFNLFYAVKHFLKKKIGDTSIIQLLPCILVKFENYIPSILSLSTSKFFQSEMLNYLKMCEKSINFTHFLSILCKIVHISYFWSALVNRGAKEYKDNSQNVKKKIIK